MINIQQIINQQVAGIRDKDRKIEHWHPSKLGQCPCGTFLERLGVPPDSEFDERTLRVFDVGHLFENWIIDLISKEKGLKLEKQVRVEDKKLDVAGFADLLIKQGREKRLYEIKSKHSRAFWYMFNEGEGANRHHEMQLWLYLKLLKMKEGSILYVSKDDLTLLEFTVRLDNKQLEKEVMSELKMLNDCWKNELLPIPAPAGSWQAKYCRWHKQCLYLQEHPEEFKKLKEELTQN